MSAIWVIAKRELQSFFDSLIAYILIVIFLAFSGFFTWILVADVFYIKQATLIPFFNISYWTLFIFIPAITMRSIAEENKSGTIELLLTKSVTDREVILGKFLASFLLVAIALAFTMPYVITIANIGSLDLGQTLSGYFGLLLMSASYISIGIYCSSVTNNQIVAFLVALVIGILFHWIFGALSSNLTGFSALLFDTLSLTSHFESIIRGVLDTRDLVYFISIILIGLILSELSLTKRNLS
jgi:ABC-2 type transport system permease protein